MKKLKKGHLFIIEDDKVTNAYYREVFKNGDYRFSFCQEFEYAVDFIKTMRPNVVILDLTLIGGITGLDILGQIGELKDVITIVITAMVDRDTRMRVLELGARDYLTKPVRKAVLKRMISCYMNISLSQ